MKKKIAFAIAGMAAALSVSNAANATSILYNYAGGLVTISTNDDVNFSKSPAGANSTDFAPLLAAAIDGTTASSVKATLKNIFSSGCIASITCVLDVQYGSGNNDYIILTDNGNGISATDVGTLGQGTIVEDAVIVADKLAKDELYATIGENGSPLTSSVPEPTTWALMLAGFGMIGFAMRKRARQNASVSFA